MGVSLSIVRALRAGGHDDVHLRDEGLQRLPDAQMLEKAARERQIVLTFDLDFGDLLAAQSRQFPSVIIFRLRDQGPLAVMPRLLQVVAEARPQFDAVAVVIVEEARCRVRRLPIDWEEGKAPAS